MDPNQTRSYQLIEARLGAPLDKYVAALRAEGQAWETIARGIDMTTNVPISGQTLRNWFPNLTNKIAS